MAIARAQLHRATTVPPTDPLIAFYRSALLELKERATQRLVRDARVLTAEARRARVLSREVAQILDVLEGQRSAWIAENVPKAYMRGVREADLGLREIGFTAGAGVPQPVVHQEAIQVLVNDLQDTLQELDDNMVRGIRRMIRRTQLDTALDKFVTERAAQAIAQGKGRRELSKEIKSRLIDEFGEKPIRIAGRNFQAGPYAELTARTKAAQAQTTGTINRVAEAGLDLVMISSHGAKDGCGFYEGRVFSISGDHEKYPSLASIPNGGPPFHPNCKHAAMPFVEDLATGAEKRRGHMSKAAKDKATGKSFAEVNRLPEVQKRLKKEREAAAKAAQQAAAEKDAARKARAERRAT